MQVHTIFEGDSTCEERLTCRHNHATATLLRALIDGLLNGFLILLCRCIGLGTEFRNHIILIRKLWDTDTLLYLLVLSFIPSLGCC